MRLQLHKRYKHFRRYHTIGNVLVKHGFGYLINSLGLTEFTSPGQLDAPEETNVPVEIKAARLRMVLEELGTTFIKLGQVLSVRSDIFAPAYIKELEKLQDKAPPVPFSAIRERLELELGQSLPKIFNKFATTPLAAASIGQVHKAELLNGTQVAVKVQRPGIRNNIEIDMEILYDLARLLERRTVWGKYYKFTEIVEEFDHLLHEELDFILEARHAETMARNLHIEQEITIPAVYWDHTTKKVLTLEYMDGIKLNDQKKLISSGHDPKKISIKLTEAVLKQILIDGFFHADPHPGNLMVLPDGKLVFLDFGIMGYLEEGLREKITRLVWGLISKNSNEIIRAIMSLGVLPAHINMYKLRRDIEHMREKYYEIPLKQITATESLGDIMDLAYHHQIQMPIEFTLIIKTLLITEGIATRLNPDISIMQIIEPLKKELIWHRLNIKSIRKLFWDNINDYQLLFTRLPAQLNQIIELLNKGEIRVKTENPDLKEAILRLNTMVNRLVYSIIVGSIIISSSWLITERITFKGVHLAEVGYIMAGVLGFWLLVMIIRSRFY